MMGLNKRSQIGTHASKYLYTRPLRHFLLSDRCRQAPRWCLAPRGAGGVPPHPPSMTGEASVKTRQLTPRLTARADLPTGSEKRLSASRSAAP